MKNSVLRFVVVIVTVPLICRKFMIRSRCWQCGVSRRRQKFIN